MEKTESIFEQVNTSFMWEHDKLRGPYNMYSNHYHNTYEIYYLLSGKRYYFIKNRTYPISAGDLVLININEIHKSLDANCPSYERICINFKKDFVANMIQNTTDIDLFSCFSRNIHVLRLNMKDRDFIENLFFKMRKEYKKRAEGCDTYIKIMLVEMLLYINRSINKTKTYSVGDPNPVHNKVSEVVKYINTNYMRSVSLSSLSETFFISPYYLSRIFKEATGFTFIEYVNSVRTKEAQTLLRKTSLNITEIAEKVGYESATHFGRVFKNHTGCSPLKYRKMVNQ